MHGLGSFLHGWFKMMTTNTFCIHLLSHGFGIVEWTKAEISQFDVMFRKILTAVNNHHPCAAIERAAWGIINIEG